MKCDRCDLEIKEGTEVFVMETAKFSLEGRERDMNMGNLKIAVRRNWPTIATVAGCTGVVAGTLMACGATRKLTTMDEKARTFAGTAVKLGKLYGPAILVQAGSIGLIGSSHGEMMGRQAALSAAYASAVSAFEMTQMRLCPKEVPNEVR